MNSRRLTASLLGLVLAAHIAAGERVVVVRDPQAVRAGEIEADRARAMVAAGMRALTGAETDAAAWSHFASSNDVVGIKIATQAAPLHYTHPPVVKAIQAGLTAAGVPAANIIVFDRDPQKLRAAGYTGAQAISPAGWDSDTFYESRVVGKLIWGDLMFGREAEGFAARSHLPVLVTRTITKLINVPVLQDNEATGIAGCLYHASVGLVDNARRFEFPGQTGDPDIALIYNLPDIRNKVVLQILDALVGGFAGGPVFRPKYSWAPAALYFSRDPVAVDTLAVAELETQRKAANIPPIADRARHVETAAHHQLGAPPRELVEVTIP